MAREVKINIAISTFSWLNSIIDKLNEIKFAGWLDE